MAQHVIYSGECSRYTWKECVFCCFWMEVDQRDLIDIHRAFHPKAAELWISIKSLWSTVFLKARVSLLIFCLDDLSIDISRVLKSLTIIMLLSISPFISVNICLIYGGAPMLGIYIYNCYIFLLDWSFDPYVGSFFSLVIIFTLKSISSNISIAILVLFWFPFAWNTFSHSPTCSLYVSLDPKWISCRLHVYRSCFCNHSASLCLLVRAFSPN